MTTLPVVSMKAVLSSIGNSLRASFFWPFIWLLKPSSKRNERMKTFVVRAFVRFIYACSFQFEILNARSRNVLQVSVGRQATGNLRLGFRRLFGRLNWHAVEARFPRLSSGTHSWRLRTAVLASTISGTLLYRGLIHGKCPAK